MTFSPICLSWQGHGVRGTRGSSRELSVTGHGRAGPGPGLEFLILSAGRKQVAVTFTGCKNRGRGPGRAEASRIKRQVLLLSALYLGNWAWTQPWNSTVEKEPAQDNKLGPQHKDARHCAPSCYLSPSRGRAKAQRHFLSFFLFDIKKKSSAQASRSSNLQKDIRVQATPRIPKKQKPKNPTPPAMITFIPKPVFTYATSQGWAF